MYLQSLFLFSTLISQLLRAQRFLNEALRDRLYFSFRAQYFVVLNKGGDEASLALRDRL